MEPRYCATNREIQDLLTPISGEAGHDEDPGHWASFIYDLKFTSARWNDYIKTAYLRWLRHRPIIREPVFRRGLNYSAGALFHMLDTQVAKVEAIYMQLVGRIVTAPCTSCLVHGGPFTTCVKIDGYPDVTCCANCHWWEEDERCQVDDGTFMHPAPPPPPAGSSRSQPSSAQSAQRSTSGTAQSSSQHHREDRHHRRQNSDHRHRDSQHNSRDHGQRGRHLERDRHDSANRQRHTSQQSNTSDRTSRMPRTLRESWKNFLLQRNEQRSQLLGHVTELETAFAREIPATNPMTEVLNALINSIMSFIINDMEMTSELEAAMERTWEHDTDTER
ncbi:hypothetical protein N7493_009288 [Penicillium malachiteum]|uniref:Uncharacterized protein n=1 Tax=Penicillium malachiteum TaxID=1324776 RepID=A0AAD6MT96_9EURO|nr:hypothetical protein N7493_009288 [Penicillium malachiteum]